MTAGDGAARLVGLRIYPIKALDPVELSEVEISAGGALTGDRRWALRDEEGRFVNGKRAPELCRIRARYELGRDEVVVEGDGGARPARFALGETSGAADFGDFVGAHLGRRVSLVRDDALGFPDDSAAWGPTLISTPSLEAVCGWFPGLALPGARRRFRANLEIGGALPAFWEDRLFAAAPDEDQRGDQIVRFRIGDVLFEGTNPCQRCSVPTRDPDTAEVWPGFAKTFGERRRETLPPWAARGRFDHFYRLAINTRVPASEAGKRLRIGDELTISK